LITSVANCCLKEAKPIAADPVCRHILNVARRTQGSVKVIAALQKAKDLMVFTDMCDTFINVFKIG